MSKAVPRMDTCLGSFPDSARMPGGMPIGSHVPPRIVCLWFTVCVLQSSALTQAQAHYLKLSSAPTAEFGSLLASKDKLRRTGCIGHASAHETRR